MVGRLTRAGGFNLPILPIRQRNEAALGDRIDRTTLIDIKDAVAVWSPSGEALFSCSERKTAHG
jgi:hypothetical protein